MIVFLNGRFVSRGKARVSIFDHGFLYGDGIYETLRTYQGKVWQVEEHVDRLFQSARMISLNLPWTKNQVKSWILKTAGRNQKLLDRERSSGRKKRPAEFRIRVTVTRGENKFDFGKAKKPTIVIFAQRLKEPLREIFKKGVSLITFEEERILPQAKTINLIPSILAQQAADKKKAFEALLVDRKGNVREGARSNFFLIGKGKLVTPGLFVLPGITRELILKIAREMMPVEIRGVSKKELYEADECFITNAPLGIIPVTKIDGRKVGSGKVGQGTLKIIKDFQDLIAK